MRREIAREIQKKNEMFGEDVKGMRRQMQKCEKGKEGRKGEERRIG